MGKGKKGLFDKADVKLARFARALAHPARIAIIRLLAAREACCFNEISKAIPLADSTVSQHLAELRKAGLINASPDLPRIRYSISNGDLKAARKLLKDIAKTGSKKHEPRMNDVRHNYAGELSQAR